MTVSRLLKSCATPPASRPIALHLLCMAEFVFQLLAPGNIPRNPLDGQPPVWFLDEYMALFDPNHIPVPVQ